MQSMWVQPQLVQRLLRRCGLGLISAAGLLSSIVATSAHAAERIAFSYYPLGEFYLSVDSLETFVEEGEVSDELDFYASFAESDDLEILRDVLQQEYDISATTVAQFTYSPIGELLLRQVGDVLQTPSNENSFYALRAALILAAAEPGGLTILDMLRQFPLDTIHVDVNQGVQLAREASQLLGDNARIFDEVQQEAIAEASSLGSLEAGETLGASEALGISDTAAEFEANLRSRGRFNWQRQTIVVQNSNRMETFPTDVYIPQGVDGAAPLVVISHGLASNRETFAYLAQHLASYGFAVAVPEHLGTSAERFEQFLAGFAPSPDSVNLINRPLDIIAVLDAIQLKGQTDPAWAGQIDVSQTGILGQSLGGYTALAVSGAELNFEQLRQTCDRITEEISFNLALLLQCQATSLSPAAIPELQDDRIQAVIAVNPLTSTIFGEAGLSQIDVPVMLVASGQDYFAPAVPEQIYPFTWLTVPERYLVFMEAGTHFSFLGGATEESVIPVPEDLIGPDPAQARQYLSALSTAFFKTYLTNQSEFAPYLSDRYLQSISEPPFNFDLVQSLTLEQLQTATQLDD